MFCCGERIFQFSEPLHKWNQAGILVKTIANRVPARWDPFQAVRMTAVAGGEVRSGGTDGKIGTQPGGIIQSKGAREAEAAR